MAYGGRSVRGEMSAAISDSEPGGGARRVWIRTLLFLAVSVILVVGWVASIAYIGSRADERVEQALEQSRDRTAQTLDRWAADVFADTRFWAAEPGFVTAARELRGVPADELAAHPLQAEMRRVGADFIGVQKSRGYSVISPDGLNLASSRDANIGVPNLIAERFPSVFAQILAGETLLTPLQVTDVPIDTELGPDPDAITLFAATPIFDDDGAVMAVFSWRIDPLTELAAILDGARLSTTGDAVLVDRAGSLLSANGEVTLDASGDALTDAVRSVQDRGTGSTLDSYRSTTDEQVVGAWRWLSDMEVGVITEAPSQDLFDESNTAQRVVTVFAAASAVLLFAVWLIPLLGSRARSRERREYLARLRDSEAKARAVLDTAVDAILTIDESGTIISANPAAERMFGWTADEMIDRNVSMLMPEPYGSEHDSYLSHYVGGGPARVIGIGRDVRGRRRDATEFPLALSVSEIGLDDRRIFAGIARDITDQKAAEAALTMQAITDQLTGLPNRKAFADALDDIVRNDEANVAVLFVDVDDFKAVNDTLGHHVGDGVLIAVGERLSSALRPHDVIYRSGGDEFLVIARDLADADAADVVARHLCEALAEPLDARGHSVRLTVSVGVAVPDSLTASRDALVKAADLALFEAKAQGRNRHHHFDVVLQAAAIERKAIEDDLHQLFANDGLCSHYQPLVDLRTGRVAGAEALARWHRPGHGLVGPDVFIPVAERSGMIDEIGRWMLHRACDDAVSWNTDRIDPIGVAVNISAPQIVGDDFIGSVHSALATSGLPAHLLTLEITESVLVSDRTKVAAVLATVSELGIEIALDDFGTGYSSLAYLRDFTISKVKIDRSFVTEASSDDEAVALLDAIVSLIHSLGLEVVAEGVEELSEAELVSDLGCDLAQGYFWSRPIPNDEFVDRVTEIERHGAIAPSPPR